jgi:hypothetical protein
LKDPFVVALFGAFVGAFFGILSGLGIEWWKSDRADFAELCREFCTLISFAADAGAEFLLTPANDARSQFMAVRVTGFQSRISDYSTILIGRISDDDLDAINGRLGRFFNAMTGDNADDPERPASRDSAIRVHDKASSAIILIRQTAHEQQNFKKTFFRMLGRTWPNRGIGMRHPKL